MPSLHAPVHVSDERRFIHARVLADALTRCHAAMRPPCTTPRCATANYAMATSTREAAHVAVHQEHVDGRIPLLAQTLDLCPPADNIVRRVQGSLTVFLFTWFHSVSLRAPPFDISLRDGTSSRDNVDQFCLKAYAHFDAYIQRSEPRIRYEYVSTGSSDKN